MKQLQIEESKAKSLYKTAAPEFKSMLEDTFGKEFFIEDITDRIKSFKDACDYLKLKTHGNAYHLFKMDRRYLHEVAIEECEDTYLRLCIYTLALNEGKPVDMTKETGYFPYFNHSKKPGSGVYCSHFYIWDGGWSPVSSRLALRNLELAIYSGNQFEQDHYNHVYN